MVMRSECSAQGPGPKAPASGSAHELESHAEPAVRGPRPWALGPRYGARLRNATPVLALILCAAPLGAQNIPTLGSPAPVVTVPDLDGKPVKIALTPGKQAAVVEFWATWCELCRALLPSMRAAKQQYGDRVDFYGVNVTVNDRKERVRKYVDENKPPYRTLYDDRGVAVRAFGAMATSYVVIIDAKGRIAYTGDGADQKIGAELAKVIRQ